MGELYLLPLPVFIYVLIEMAPKEYERMLYRRSTMLKENIPEGRRLNP
jgi:hypothetical protein